MFYQYEDHKVCDNEDIEFVVKVISDFRVLIYDDAD